MSIKNSQFAEIIKSFEFIYKAHICFHDNQNKLSDLLPKKYFNHNEAICSSVKTNDMITCKKIDVILSKNKAQNTDHGFWKICHVGIMELYIPLIHPEKNIQYGSMFIGLFYPNLKEKKMLKSELFKDVKFESHLEKIDESRMHAIYESSKLLKFFIEKHILIGSSSSEQIFDRKESIYFYLSENLEKPISLKDVSKFLNLSYTRSGQIIKECFDITFPELLMNIRLERAAEILLVTNWSISKIAKETGFRDPEYFHKAFKKKYDMSPIKYKNNMLNTKDIHKENV